MTETSARDIIEHGMAEDLLIAPVANDLLSWSLEWSVTYCEPTSNSALRIDLEGALALGRLTLWSSGNAYLEVLRNTYGAQFICANIIVNSDREAVGALKVLAAAVAQLPSNNSFNPMPLRGTG